jgi:hypothetical protein
LRSEDKEIDGPELERSTRLTGAELERRPEEELPSATTDEAHRLDRSGRGQLLDAMQAILAHDQVVVDMLPLHQQHLRALEALKAAVEGRDAKLNQFVYATDRRQLLEQALAVLQPNLAHNDPGRDKLAARIGDLRHDLLDLRDAQDELLVGHDDEQVKATPDDTAPPEDVDPEAPKPPSTLYGDGVEEAAKPTTSLGDPDEIAAAQRDKLPSKKPWWKKPFG